MEEKTFFNEGGVTVTNARFIAMGETYAMSGITSVKIGQEKKGKVWPALMILFGGIFMMGFVQGETGVGGFGFALLAVGIALILRKPKYLVRLATSGGEVTALSSKNSEWINQVVSALNDSIVHRG